MKDGIMYAGETPEHWGFTKERFAGDSYVWREGNRVMISFIESLQPGKGHFSALVKAIEADGLIVDVPTPLGKMQKILARWDFEPRFFKDAVDGSMCEVWARKTPSAGKSP